MGEQDKAMGHGFSHTFSADLKWPLGCVGRHHETEAVFQTCSALSNSSEKQKANDLMLVFAFF